MGDKKIYEKRIEKLREILEKRKLDAVALFSGESHNDLSSKNTYYLTGFFDSWPHAVIVTKKDAALFTGEPERAEKESAIKNIKYSKKETVEKFLKTRRIKRLGVDSNFSFGRWNEMKKNLKSRSFSDVSREMIELRAKKDNGEISKIKRACDITSKALKAIQDNVNLRDEGALVQKIKTVFMDNGAEMAFKPVVSGDKNSVNIHYFACNSKYQKLVMADIGARWNFYNSDFTRTYILQQNREMIRARDSLAQLVDELRDTIKPGMRCIDAVRYAKSFLEKAGYKKQSFVNFHSMGHGVGLDVHEYPNLTLNPLFKEMKFEENMVFTLEPALYFAGKFGARIEDTVLMTKNGVKRLSRFKL